MKRSARGATQAPSELREPLNVDEWVGDDHARLISDAHRADETWRRYVAICDRARARTDWELSTFGRHLSGPERAEKYAATNG